MKRILTKALALALVLALALPAAVPAQAAFSDVSDPVVREAVEFLCNMGIVTSADNYRPNDLLDKATYCKLAVDITGFTDLDRFRDFTIFPDVRAGHWALAYINAAVRELNIIKGKPDGSFGPGDPISYNEAATLLVRLLGYSEKELGYNWPRNYVNKAAALGLNKGVTVSGNVTRGQAAVLFHNLLFTKTRGEDGKSGPLFIDGLKSLAQPVEVVITDVNGLSADGKSRGLVVVGGDGFYKLHTPLDQSLTGRRGELIADSDGFVVRFAPAEQTFLSIDFKSGSANGITDTDNKTTKIPLSATVYDNGTATKYSSVWSAMRAGDTLRVFFTASGAVDYIIWGHDSEGALHYTTESGGARAIYNAFSVQPDSVTVIKNGAVTSPDSIAPYDTLSYLPGSGRVSVSSLRVTGPYTDSAATGEDDSITLLGKTFPLSENASAQAISSRLRVGSWVTACVSADGTVNALYTTSKVKSNLVGWAISDTAMVTLGNLEFSGGTKNYGTFKGMLVTGTGTANGLSMSMVRMNGSGGGASFDAKAGTLGKYKVAEWCRYFTSTGDMTAPIDMDEVPASAKSNQIKHFILDDNKNVEVIVFNNLNGDALRYGFFDYDRAEGPALGEAMTFRMGGDSIEVYTGSQFLGVDLSGIVGISLITKEDKLYAGEVFNMVSYMAGTEDFDGTDSAVVDGVRIPVAKDCLIRVTANTYVPLERLGDYADSDGQIRLVCDKKPEDGGKVRMIMLP